MMMIMMIMMMMIVKKKNGDSHRVLRHSHYTKGATVLFFFYL